MNNKEDKADKAEKKKKKEKKVELQYPINTLPFLIFSS